jgi:hypothetical protein
MQSSDTIRLARRIRKKREKKKRGKLTPWRVVCEELNIRTENGNLDTGLAFKIGYQEYDPSDRALRHRLGLRDLCSKCKRVFRAVKLLAPKPALSAARVWFNGLKREEQEKVLELSYKQFLNWKQRR